MAVKPVEYKKDRSTQGFAVAGDEKPITQTNANTIQKDVNQGNTKDLDNAQDKYLSSLVDEDTIDYTADEQKNVGANQIDTEGTEKTSGGEKAASVTETAAIAGGFLFAYPIVNMIEKFIKIPSVVGHAIAAGLMLAAAALVLPVVNAFDSQYSERTSQRDSAEDTNNTLQAYNDTLSTDMDDMVNDSDRYKELIAGKTQADIDMITEIGVLQAELAVYQAQGDTEKAAEIQAKIDEIKNGAKDDSAGAELGDIKEGLETYAGHYNESLGVAESGTTVTEFLKQGDTMGMYGSINTVMLALASIKAVICAASAIKSIKLPWDAPIAFAAAAIDITVGVLFLTATAKMASKTKNEFDCGSAGDEMHGFVTNLNDNIEAQGGFTEETSAGYAEGDAEYTQTTQKTQEGVDKALQNQQGRLNPVNNPKGTPDNNPNPEPEPEEPAA